MSSRGYRTERTEGQGPSASVLEGLRVGMPPRLCPVQGVPVPSESTSPHAHGQCGLMEVSPGPQLSSSTTKLVNH